MPTSTRFYTKHSVRNETQLFYNVGGRIFENGHKEKVREQKARGLQVLLF